MLRTIAVSGYRSIGELVVPLEALTVITGTNTVGTSPIYRALKLMAVLGHDGAITSLARSWAPARADPGLPIPQEGTLFGQDPVIKAESV